MPARGIDLIRDGLDADTLTAKGSGRRLYGALVSTAMWAQARGMAETDWCGLLAEPSSMLGRQTRTLRNGTSEAPKRTRDRLTRAWAAASHHRAEDPDWTADDAHARARATAQAARDLVADADTDLTDGERAVLDHVAKVADERGSDRLTLPRQAMLTATGLGLTALRTALANLDRRGLLVLAEAGRPRTQGKPRRANVYRLAVDLTPRAGLAVPPARVSGAPESVGLVPPAPLSGAPLSDALAAYLHTPEGVAAARAILDRQEPRT